MYVNGWLEMTALPVGTIFLLKDGSPGQTYHPCDNTQITNLAETGLEHRDSLTIASTRWGFTDAELEELHKAAARLLPALVLNQPVD